MGISYEEFERVDLRSGTVVKVEEFPRAKKPAFKVWVNFGEGIGILQTSAQITDHYTVETLMGRTVVGCVNLGEKTSRGLYLNFYWWVSQMRMVKFACLPQTEKCPMDRNYIKANILCLFAKVQNDSNMYKVNLIIDESTLTPYT
nr:hypothetical protein [Legionella israelensis]